MAQQSSAPELKIQMHMARDVKELVHDVSLAKAQTLAKSMQEEKEQKVHRVLNVVDYVMTQTEYKDHLSSTLNYGAEELVQGSGCRFAETQLGCERARYQVDRMQG